MTQLRVAGLELILWLLLRDKQLNLINQLKAMLVLILIFLNKDPKTVSRANFQKRNNNHQVQVLLNHLIPQRKIALQVLTSLR
jgi:hypothetical protein